MILSNSCHKADNRDQKNFNTNNGNDDKAL